MSWIAEMTINKNGNIEKKALMADNKNKLYAKLYKYLPELVECLIHKNIEG